MADFDERVWRSIGRKLKQLREQRGWSQEELAERVGRTDKHISEVERGKPNVGVALLVRSADVFGVSINEFFREFSADTSSAKTYTISQQEFDRLEDALKVVERLKRRRARRKRSK